LAAALLAAAISAGEALADSLILFLPVAGLPRFGVVGAIFALMRGAKMTNILGKSMPKLNGH
jgi:hypothetical protein